MKVALVVLAILLLCACGAAVPPTIGPTATPLPTATPTPIPPCQMSDGRKAFDVLYALAQEWDDAAQLADKTARLSLSPQIAALQAIRRKVEAEQWPGCANSAHTLFKQAMDKYIDGFIIFLGSKTTTTPNEISQGNELYKQFIQALAQVPK